MRTYKEAVHIERCVSACTDRFASFHGKLSANSSEDLSLVEFNEEKSKSAIKGKKLVRFTAHVKSRSLSGQCRVFRRKPNTRLILIERCFPYARAYSAKFKSINYTICNLYISTKRSHILIATESKVSLQSRHGD